MKAGDFTVRLPRNQAGLAGKVADTFNDIVAANQRMAEQLETVGQVVGREGKTRTRVTFSLAGGAWSDMESSVNTLIDDLLWPTTAVTRSITAVAKGDLLQPMPLDVDGRPLKGEFLRAAKIVNAMIKQLSVFTSEVTRVAREVGTDGKLGGQAKVSEVTGVWRELTESVNSMASNLTGQVRNIAEVTIAVANGDLSKKITVDVRGENPAAERGHQHHGRSAALVRVGSDARGARGRYRGQARRPGTRAGRRRDLEGPDRLGERHVRQPHRAGPQHRPGDDRRGARRPVAQDHRGRSGEILELKETINTMVDQLNGFAGEVTRVAREVGTEGRLGGQAQVPGVAGNVEGPHRQRQLDGLEPDGPGSEHRRGLDRDRERRPVEEDHCRRCSGEILELKETINTMVDQLNAFASEVTRVAREVGTEGRLGGQANVLGVAGTWKDLTDTSTRWPAT